MKHLKTIGFALAVTVTAHNALAQDKSAYTLFNPTPDAQLRDLSTDRPDKTESAYTVDAGRFQIEADLVGYTHDHDKDNGNNIKTKGFGLAVTNFKAGLLHNLDLQVVVETYAHQRVTDLVAGSRDTASGFGDVTTRLKYNVWGNDGGQTALALMPFVKFPANQDDLGNDAVEGGIIVPLAIDIGNGWGMGLMTQLNINEDSDGSGYMAEYVNSVTVARDITERLGAYAEIWTSKSAEDDSDWIVTFDLGSTYAMTDNLQLDIGINIGVTDAADDWNPFLGVSWRF